MNGFDDLAHPRAGDGKFAAKPVAETPGGLSALSPADDVGNVDAALATDDELRAQARHPDPAVRVDVLASAHVPYDVVVELADPRTQPVVVRHAAAASFHAGAAARGARDPNPVVRAAASGGWDLDESGRERARQAADALIAS
ncbi:hypothetical protein [Oerskovia enterophila]|uniref:Uncharacterized protein n=1 Tax=Oerskovia enterophila TaxID=43678 RepID=A0ABX2Y877_9CELL|nr:hypothetical protein [Oerskovia enterophila]OCI32800.1 hypothetical protein OERS_03920 [Oerskovia enterophila]